MTCRDVAALLRKRWIVVEVAATVSGTVVLVTFLHAFHAAVYAGHASHDLVSGSLGIVAYLAFAFPLGAMWREHRTRSLWTWLCDERPPTPAERDAIVRAPLRELTVPAVLWAGAAVLFGTLEAVASSRHAIDLVLTIGLGGVTTCALIYLFTERLMRPVTALALDATPAEQPVGPGVATRLVTAWALASGIPMLGMALISIGAIGTEIQDTTALAVALLVLAAGGLAAGATGVILSARSLADPIAGVRRALARVRAGDFDAHVAVDDGSEVGLLQAGFNDMAAGLRERERLRDIFGRHVGEDVARRALSEGVALGGEVREVAALFVDLVGSTTLATRRAPGEVVALLNRFFAVVVDVVGAAGGWVNRFEGDGALCVFGAPTEQPDAAERALRAGRLLHQRLTRELPDLEFGIGISAGPAVAGNVGALRRLEYTVIGDAVNEAARLCELAKRETAGVIASGATVARASDDEAARWALGDERVLRGRAGPTRLATPAAAARPADQAPALPAGTR